MTHKAKIVTTGYVNRCDHGRLWNSELSEHFVQRFESYGFDQAMGSLTSVRMRYKYQRATYYPSTPASKALRLSSRVDMPVRIRMRVLFSLGFTDSIRRISFVAPTPSSFGIDMSRSTMLMFDRQQEEPATTFLSGTHSNCPSVSNILTPSRPSTAPIASYP